MSLTVHQYHMADVRIERVFGERGLGIYALRFSVNFSIINQYPDDPPDMFIDCLRANVWVHEPNGERLLLGAGEFERPLIVRRLIHSTTQSSLLRVTFGDVQLLALEELRGGGGVVFEVEVTGLAHAPHDVYPTNQNVRIEVNLSDWVKVLESLEAADSFVVGVDIPLSAPTQLGHAVEYLKKARHALVVGEYEHTVAACRLALDSLKEASPILAQLSKSVWEGKSKDFSKTQRAAVLYNAVRNYTHLSHHVGGEGRLEVFSRRDAVMVLTTASSLVGMVAELVEPPLME
ncbi:hypothetical protein Y045_4623 [Burkholderia pseudomallei MSHR2451]|uniref:hypothetical protein n=1 Tax=Burkholderia pseudomallei TaxID=28450 RepID=UPI000538AE4A|nr:hypothetical protein [Burkholderia pseudomallei]KGW33867.1 hypothetical protein Y045_4623 [Burkholderia pseudomallei MSHR2451]CRY45827.1 Uncharacterised protein [Burkholderia pseudomallei]